MSRKKLPSALRHTMDGLREAAAGNGNASPRTPVGMMASSQLAGETSAAPVSDPAHDAIETRRTPPVSGTTTPGRATSMSAGVDPAKRRAQARAIVERHATYSAVGGILPLPIASVAGITTIIIRMVKMLSNLYGVPFEVTTSTLFFAVPSGALIGTVVSAVSAIACTRSIGRVFIEHFESGATLDDFRAPKKK